MREYNILNLISTTNKSIEDKNFKAVVVSKNSYESAKIFRFVLGEICLEVDRAKQIKKHDLADNCSYIRFANNNEIIFVPYYMAKHLNKHTYDVVLYEEGLDETDIAMKNLERDGAS